MLNVYIPRHSLGHNPSLRRISRAIVAVFSVVASAVIPLQSFAATTTTTFQVTATVAAACSVSASNLSFGTYNPVAGSALDASTSLSVTCTLNSAYNVGLNAGTGSGASVATRKMSSGGNTLNYTLYQDAGYTTLWGNTVGSDTLAATGTGLPVSHTVYGRIPASQVVLPASYADTITVTVTF